MSRPATSFGPKTTDFRSIDLAWLRRKGARNVGYSGTLRWLHNGHVEAGGLRLRYRVTPRGGSPQDINEVIPIVRTPMHLGGFRHWFECPSCGRRCRIVYGGVRFRCRQCRGAKYESQYQHPALTLCDMRWRIRERLEERGSLDSRLSGLDDGLPPKPKGMHWSSYRRLEALDDKLAGRWRIGVGGRLVRNRQRRAGRRAR
jgi:hypothetical protein